MLLSVNRVTAQRKWPGLARRIALWGAALLAVLVVVAAVVARVFFHGDRLAALIENELNARFRGRVEIQSVEWPWRALPKAATGGWVEVEVRGVKVYDWFGDLVLDVPYARAKLDAHPAMFGRHDFVFDDIYAPGGYVLIREEEEPYPENEHDQFVVTLVSAFYANKPPNPNAPKKPSSTFDLRSFRVEQVELALDFPTFTGVFHGAAGGGWLFRADPTGHKQDQRFSFQLTDATAPEGSVEILGARELQFRDVHVPRVGKVGDPAAPRMADVAPDLTWEATAVTPEGADVTITGGMFAYWNTPEGGTYDILVTFRNAGALLARVSDGVARGPSAVATITVEGNRRAPVYRGTVTDAELAVPMGSDDPLALTVPAVTASWASATRTGELTDTVVRGQGGELRASARYGFASLADDAAFTYDVDLAIPVAIDIGRWLDPDTRRIAGTELSGRAHARNIDDGVRIDDVDVRLGAARARGVVEYTADGVLRADGLRVDVGKTWARADGLVRLTERTLELTVRFTSDDLPRWLRRFDQPAIARAAGGTATVRGTFDEPTVPSADVWARGVPVVGTARGRVSYGGGRLRVPELTARPFGGTVRASAELALDGAPRIVDARISGTDFDLAAIDGDGDWLSGTGRFSAQAEGPLSAPTATFVGEVDELHIAGDEYRNFLLTGGADAAGFSSVQLHVDRARGGRLDVTGTVGHDGAIDGVVSAREIPLHSLPFAPREDGKPIAGGVANVELQLSGTTDAPTADGDLQIAKAWFKNSFLGAAELSLERIGLGRMRVWGMAFQGALGVDGELATAPGYEARLDLVFRRVELDQFFPELAAEYGVHAWMSGTLRNLIVRPGAPPSVQIELTELVVVMDNEDARGRPRPLRVRNLGPIAVEYDGVTATLLSTAQLRGPTGDFQLEGRASLDALALRLEGTVDVALLQPYLREQFEESRGVVNAAVDITGTAADPLVTGVLDVEQVNLRPLGQDAQVRIPAVGDDFPEIARIEVTNDQLTFTGFSVDVVDEITNEVSVLELTGTVGLDQFKPARWAVIADGAVAGKLLLVLLPDQLSAASGSAEVQINLTGEQAMPRVNGVVIFDRDNPITFTPRALRREIVLNTGEVSFTDQLVEFISVGGTIDDAGLLTDLSGEISMEDWAPVDVDVKLSAEALPYRIPQTLELDLNIDGLRIVGSAEGLEISGAFDIIDGRYVQRFNPLLDALRPERVEESEPPFYENVPLLANARLDLTVTTGGGFAIDNNIANVELDGTVNITRTPRDPRIDGEIRVERGAFKFQGMRARFTRTEGTIQFSRFETIPDGTPFVSIRSEADYQDSRGDEHVVVLVLEGTLPSLDWDLFTTNTGLNKAQTFSLIATGRTADETRALVGDEPVARGPGELGGTRSTASQEGTFSAADQLFKDLAGDFLAVLIEDPLKNFVALDVIRPEVNTSAVGIHVEKNFGRNTRLIGEWERTLRGETRLLRGEHRLTQGWSIEAEWLYQDFEDDVEEDTNRQGVQFIFRGKTQ